MSLEEAASFVHDGEHVALGGCTMSRTPIAMIWALIRAGRKNLTVSRSIVSTEGDLLYASGAHKVFDESGKLLQPAFTDRVDNFLDELIWMATTLRHGRERVDSDTAEGMEGAEVIEGMAGMVKGGAQ